MANGNSAISSSVCNTPLTGTKLVVGRRCVAVVVAAVRAKGVAAIPDDPLSLACVAGLTVRENLALGSGSRYRRRSGASIGNGLKRI